MPTDEQLRKQFEKWLVERGLTDEVWLQDPYTSWSIDDMHDVYRARDAEVQALREALTYALHVLECLKADNPNPLLPNARWRSVDMARAALAGGEKGETE